MQQSVLRLISEVSNKAEKGGQDDLEQLTESLHTVEKAFVKAYYSQHALVAAEFRPVGVSVC